MYEAALAILKKQQALLQEKIEGLKAQIHNARLQVKVVEEESRAADVALAELRAATKALQGRQNLKV